jgi:hypothetical protein
MTIFRLHWVGAAILGLAAPVLVALAGCARSSAQSAGSEAHGPGTSHSAASAEAGRDCESLSIDCGNTPSLVFDPSGRLWAAFEQGGRAYVVHSDDTGRSFSPPIAVNAEPEGIETNGEGRPKIAVGPEGTIYVSWTRKLAKPYSGDIRFSRSLDGGAGFEAPRTVNDDGLEIGHRFDSLFVDSNGDVYLTWVDKRDLDAAESRGEAYLGASLFYTVSTDRGASFVPNRRVAHHACECCRIVAAPAPGGGAAVLWRHVFDGSIRDHAFAVLDTEGVSSPMRRVSHEGWVLDACPHHGPAIVPDGSSGYHMAWFSAAGKRPTIYYGWLDPASGETRNLREVVTGRAEHADIVRAGDRLLLVWKQADRGRTDVVGIASIDAGLSWSEPAVVASTKGGSDHPFLLSHDDRGWLAWHTQGEGLRLVSIDNP